MCEKLKNKRTIAAELCNLEFGHYPFIKDKMSLNSSMHEHAQEYINDEHYNNYKHPSLHPNANTFKIKPRARPPAVIETKTPNRSYREAVCGNKSDDAMSISSKQDPISTTSPITGGSPNSNKSELTELKREISDLHTQITGFQTLMTNMHEELKAREERDRQDRLERDAAMKAREERDRQERLERDKREQEDKKEREEKDRELQMKIMAHQVQMDQKVVERENKMMAFFQSMMQSQKQFTVAIQPRSMVTSPLTSLNSGNNSSNKRVCKDQSGDDPSQQLTTAEIEVNNEDENNGMNVQEQQHIEFQQQVLPHPQPQYYLPQYFSQQQPIMLPQQLHQQQYQQYQQHHQSPQLYHHEQPHPISQLQQHQHPHNEQQQQQQPLTQQQQLEQQQQYQEQQ